MIKNKKGFTLIELLVATLMGTTISIAAISLYLSSQRDYLTQKAIATTVGEANDALEYIAEKVARSNQDKSYVQLVSNVQNSGVVLSAAAYGSGVSVPNANISQSAKGYAFTTDKSDQLVIQYLPKVARGQDCEGGNITSTSAYVVERYFVRVDSSDSSKLVLACDAGRYASGSFSGLGGNGIILMHNVDYFRVLLGVKNATSFREMSISDYNALSTKMPILSVSIGVLAHSNNKFGRSDVKNNKATFRVLDKDVKLNSTASSEVKNFSVYQPFARTIALNYGIGGGD